MGVSALELRRRVLMEAPHRVIESGSSVSFETYVRQKLPVTVDINPVQAGSGDPSPENVRPISGWTGANVGCTGKNILGGIALANAVVSAMPSATVSEENKTVTFASNATVDHAIVGTADDGIVYGFSFDENTQYTFVFSIYKNTGVGSNLCITYTDGTTDDIPSVSATTTKETVVFTSDEGKTIKRIGKRNASGSTRLYYDESGIFEGALTVHDFEEWVGTIFHTTFPAEAGTVYGGTLTINKDGTGTLVVDHAKRIIDNNISFTNRVSNQNRVWYTVDDMPSNYKGLNDSLALCDKLPKGNTSSQGFSSASISIGHNNKYVYLNGVTYIDSSITSYNTLISWLQDNPITYTYELAEPQTYQLTALQVIEALQGMNNIFADTGDVTVEFWTN